MNFKEEGWSPGLKQMLEPFVKEGIPFNLYEDLDSKHRFVKETGRAMASIEIQTPEVDTDETWRGIADVSEATGLPVKVFGGYTNTLIGGNDFKGILVTHQFHQGRGRIRFNKRGGTITAPGAVSLARVAKFACDRGYDLSFLAGIPGTLAGATVGNSGRSLTGENIGDYVRRISTYDLLARTKLIFEPEKQGRFFHQRGSRLAKINHPVTELVVRSVVLAPPFIGEKAKEKLAKRKSDRATKNWWAADSAGSFWINRDERLTRIEGGLTREYIRRLMEEGVKLNQRNIYYSKYYQFVRIKPEGRVESEVRGESGFFKITSERIRKATDADVANFLQRTINALYKRWGFRPKSEVTILGPDGALNVEEYINASIR